MNGEDTNLKIFEILGEIKEAVGAQAQNTENLRNELFADGGRVRVLEQRANRSDNRQWIHSAVLLPVMTILHMLLHKLGLQV